MTIIAQHSTGLQFVIQMTGQEMQLIVDEQRVAS